MSQFTDTVNRLAKAQTMPPAPSAQTRPSCTAAGCPMAGSLSDSSRKGVWWCAYHLACPEENQGRITEVLQKHARLLRIINEGRTCIARQPAAVHAQQWELLKRQYNSWCLEQEDPTDHIIDRGPTFESWLTRVETKLGGFVQRALSSSRRRGA